MTAPQPDLPIVVGASGLTGRPKLPPRLPEELDPYDAGDGGGPRTAMPPNCRRVLSSPLRHEGCAGCPGHQREGGCLLDIVRAAQEAGVEWRFEVDPRDGFWDYAGDPIPGFSLVKDVTRVGVHEGTWEEGAKPDSLAEIGARILKERPPMSDAHPSFDCPHCGAHVEQDPYNFHWWCPACGRNASEEAN